LNLTWVSIVLEISNNNPSSWPCLSGANTHSPISCDQCSISKHSAKLCRHIDVYVSSWTSWQIWKGTCHLNWWKSIRLDDSLMKKGICKDQNSSTSCWVKIWLLAWGSYWIQNIDCVSPREFIVVMTVSSIIVLPLLIAKPCSLASIRPPVSSNILLV